MNDIELAEEIERHPVTLRLPHTCKPNSLEVDIDGRALTYEENQQIIAALRRESERPPSGEMVTEAMQDAARGILQAIRCNPGVTEHQVYQHCKLRGDSTKGLHENDGSYVTEARAAAMIYRAMLSAAEASKEAK